MDACVHWFVRLFESDLICERRSELMRQKKHNEAQIKWGNRTVEATGILMR